MSQLCTHQHTHIRAHTHALTPTLSILLGMRTSALNFVFGTRLFPRVGQPLPSFLYSLFTHFARHSLTGLFSSWNQRKTKTTGKPFPLFFRSGNKNKLNGKNSRFFFSFSFFSNSRHNVYQYSNLSVRLSVCLSPLPGTVCEHRVT